MDVVGSGERTDLLADMLPQRVLERVHIVGLTALERHEHRHRFPLHIVRTTHRGRLGHQRMAHQRAFDLDGGEPVAGDVEHVIDPAHDPVVAIGVLPGVVASEILSRHAGPIGLPKPLVIAPDAPEHAGPRLCHHEPAALTLLDRIAGRIDDLGADAGQRQRATARLGGRATGQRAHHDAARLGLPPGVHDRAPRAADHLVVPHPGLGIDPLADGAQQPQAREIATLDVLHAPLHERADGGGSGVEDRRLLLLDDFPEAALVRGVGRPFIDQNARAGGQGAVGHVAVPRDPAAVGGAPEEVVVAQVKHPLRRGLCPEQVAGGRVLDALRLSGRAAGVEDEERRLRIHGDRRRVGGHAGDEVVPPDVAARHHVHGLAGPLEHDHVLHGRRFLQRLIDVFLEGQSRSTPPAAVGGDHGHGLGVFIPVGDRLAGEPAEDHGVHRADPGAGEHRDHEFGRHRHVDRDDLAGLDPEFLQTGGTLADLREQLAVGVGASFARGLAHPHQGCLLSPAGGDVRIEAGSRCIHVAIHEPLGRRRLPIENLRVGLHPGEQLGAGVPETLGVAGRLVVGPPVVLERTDPCAGGKLRRWRKHAAFLHDTGNPAGSLVWLGHKTAPPAVRIR